MTKPSIISIETEPVSNGKKTKLTVTTNVGVFTRTTNKAPKFLVIVSPQIEANARRLIERENKAELGPGNREWYQDIAEGKPVAAHGVTVEEAKERMARIDARIAATEERIADMVAKSVWSYVSWNGRRDLAVKEVNSMFSKWPLGYDGRSFFIIDIEAGTVSEAK